MPIGQDREPELRQGAAAGQTVQLGADYLAYAREQFDAGKFKDALVERLLPTVPRRGDPREINPGEAFGKFEIVDFLGKGGMAQVYLAKDPERASDMSLGGSRSRREQVAVKVMKAEIAHNPDYVRRFLREAANTALIEHPNVVQVFEVGSVEGRLYFTMELIEGVTLKEHLRGGPVSEEEGVQILCQLVDGLVAAHERGIGHRDLKPSNLMVVTSEDKYGFGIEGDFDVCVKVTDFGLAQQMELDKSDIMSGGRFLGTAKYVAPEVVTGEPATLRSDVFSLGILAFQMFAGRAPFRARNKIEYITANVNDDHDPLHTVVPVSRDLSRLVDAMLEKDPQDRPVASGLRRDLGRLAARREREPILVLDDPTSIFTDAGEEEGWGGLADPGALSWVLPVVAGGVALLLIVFAFARWTRDDPTPGPSERRAVVPTPTQVASRTASPTPSPTATGPKQPPALLDPIGPLPRSAYRDALARAEFTRAVDRGDRAWERGDGSAAHAAWKRAAAKLKGEVPEGLARRLKAAAPQAALVVGRAHEEAGRLAEALEAYETGLATAADDAALLERATAVRRRIEKLKQLESELKRARNLAFNPKTRPQAVKVLRALMLLARELDRVAEVEAALEKLGARAKPRAALTSEQRSRLADAAKLIDERSWDAAEMALERLAGELKEAPEWKQLDRRMRRVRAAPKGSAYVEFPAADPKALPRGLYARLKPITHREYLAWFERASKIKSLRPPSSWGGQSQPPAGILEKAVRGVRIEEARKFASDLGERLPTAAERRRIEEVTGIKPEVEKRGRFPRGFRTVKDSP